MKNKKKKKCKVYIIESELGWGQKIEGEKEFDTPEEARKFCKKYNNKHCPPLAVTPDWYMYARMEGQEEFGMIR